MSAPRLRAVVLAAGRGRRLRPLTDTLPKPLLPVRGRPVAGHTLAQVAALGCEAAALNLHHRGETIRERFGESFAGMPLHYSHEEELLGTLGALGPLREFLRAADLALVVNGDSLCRWPLRRLVRRHLRGGAAATLLVARRADPGAFGGGLGIDREGRVVSCRPGAGRGAVRHRVFAGAHIFSPRLLERLESGPRDFVTDLWEPLLVEGAELRAVETLRAWHDLGSPRRYLRATLRWSAGPWPTRRRWVAPGARLAAGAAVGHAVVEAGAAVGARARVTGSLLLPGAELAEGCRVTDTIIADGVLLPHGAEVEHRLVTPARANMPLREQDSMMGGLVYTPLDVP